MRERDVDEWRILGELVDIEPIVPGEPVVLDEDEADDFTVDDRDVSVGPPFGYDWESGTYYVEANSGPGWDSRRYSGATNVPRPTSP